MTALAAIACVVGGGVIGAVVAYVCFVLAFWPPPSN